MRLICEFGSDDSPSLSEVGGKALGLIDMTAQGLPVPPGFVLTVRYFQPWIDAVRETPEWRHLVAQSGGDLKQSSQAVRSIARTLTLDADHRQILSDAVRALCGGQVHSLFAVRSSSPEEDTERGSFAGAYETMLGVRPGEIEDAVHQAFASAFDQRVLLYKREQGYAIDEPRIAVIVQQQIDADAAGVAFSLNPLSNCYDEAVINANYGLGETVVSGTMDPDSFTVDKVSRSVLEQHVGRKEHAVWLAQDGGTYRAPPPSPEGPCLSEAQTLSITDLVIQVEQCCAAPVDIEWAYAEERLYLLQARPITTYFALPERMISQPGAQKTLYGDVTLTKWGMQDPVSVLGTDYLRLVNHATLRMTMGDVSEEVIEQMRFAVDGRVYSNLSHSIKMQGMKRATRTMREFDALSAEIVERLDPSEYVPEHLPPELRGMVLKMVGQNLGLLSNTLHALARPKQYEQAYLDMLAGMEDDLDELKARADMGLEAFTRTMMDGMITCLVPFFASIFAAEIAKMVIKRMFGAQRPEIREQSVHLDRALPNNVTIEMGLEMHRLAQFDELRTCDSGAGFAARLRGRAFSDAFLQEWDAFTRDYGFRSPMEMDPAAPRYYEQPERLFEQLKTLSESVDSPDNPQAMQERMGRQREQAYEALHAAVVQKRGLGAPLLRKMYEVWMALAGYRETPKYYVAKSTDLVRRRALAAGHALAEQGRLDRPEQVFDLHLDEVDRAFADRSLDLRALARDNTAYLRRFASVSGFPRLVDSRGKIPRLPQGEAKEGELAGQAISPGVVRGPIKTLRDPEEKPVQRGDILVARATDPGWTPLFINAAGIILEVGGALQHGALVAREYGKPCVSGIDQALETLADGEIVEVDGTHGVVRLLERRLV